MQVYQFNLAIRNNNPSKVERATRDIDGDWGRRISREEKRLQVLI